MPDLAAEMNDAALEAMKLTRKYFVVELDFSDASIQKLEPLFDDVEFTMRGGKSDENVDLLTRVWGSYLGEVIRRNVGGEWTAATEEAADAGLLIHGKTICPHDAVRKRLLGDAPNSVWEYYQQQAGNT